ncbi:hypothetical protein [Georgenia sp. Marseille-Q6866]
MRCQASTGWAGRTFHRDVTGQGLQGLSQAELEELHVTLTQLRANSRP